MKKYLWIVCAATLMLSCSAIQNIGENLLPTITNIPIEEATSLTITNTPSPTLEPTRIPQSGDTRISYNDGMTLVYIAPGEFTMGANDRYDYAKPAHSVYLDGYWIDQTEVTNQMYAEFLNAVGNQWEQGGYWIKDYEDYQKVVNSDGIWEAIAGFDDHPVVLVSWYGAKAYCEWAGRRLPTEAEWEKAARGSDGRTFPWGEDPNYCRYVQVQDGCDTQERTVPVGSFPNGASPYGIFNMGGNVEEWVFDWYSETYFFDSPLENPQGPDFSDKNYKVLKGGSWKAWWNKIETFNRWYRSPEMPLVSLGFRCATSP